MQSVTSAVTAAVLANTLLFIQGCGGSAAQQASTASSDATTANATNVAPADYCERAVDLYCPFYLRCERMAVDSMEACRSLFLETCESRYEPVYAALADAGLLSLAESGLRACAQHLQDVACTQQLRDLDGPCQQMWRGQQHVGAACAPGLQSLVCASGTQCVLGLDGCGSCRAEVAAGESCGGRPVCDAESWCNDEDICEARRAVGERCSAGELCAAGAQCVDGHCKPFTYAQEGEACDAFTRCVYGTACVDGRCRASARLSEPCSDAKPCESGACVGGACVPRRDSGSACSAHDECLSGACLPSGCAHVPSGCFAP